MTEPLLTVVMSCFNQADTVSQAIESVLMQKTDFPVRLIVYARHFGRARQRFLKLAWRQVRAGLRSLIVV